MARHDEGSLLLDGRAQSLSLGDGRHCPNDRHNTRQAGMRSLRELVDGEDRHVDMLPKFAIGKGRRLVVAGVTVFAGGVSGAPKFTVPSNPDLFGWW